MVARVVVAAPGSGHGKTTVATGLMAALRARGTAVSGHKVGPDYIDPGYHAMATGRPPRNLDPFLQGEDRLVPLLLHGSAGAEVAVIEGVMGLFDGALGTDGYASTAHVAKLVQAPVVLVVDASAASRSVAALVLGFARYDPQVHLAGVVLNKLGSQRHEDEIRGALAPTGIPVLGALRRSDEIHAPSRHLGLVPAAERETDSRKLLPKLAEWIAGGVDLDAIVRAAREAPALGGTPWSPVDVAGAAPDGPRAVVAAAAGEAFTFRYTENTELLAALGVDVVDLDPLHEATLPADCHGVYFGGGFPEAHLEALSANESLRAALARALAGGMPAVAECAGLLYLCRELDGLPMVGAIDATARMTRRGALGYRTATSASDNVLASAGDTARGHEFHRTVVEPRAGASPAWTWHDEPEGFATPTLHASYLHVHWAGHPELARAFAGAARRRARG
ncbi:cobyrinate a,c-diamide synthase [Prauserella rugosa]|uniref:Hydrogenobyrinate a,c-diamide synthase n=1 Tax=Prauserella rugosa TaxID=43354 RepID=A0A660CND0_9PSEU|nr:cobyrinate a,c-diamide synthase [Prauserella rugosa]KID30990.1 cobyrinic acid a,c-diamide synthase [Prauserella sp. Am3]KMS92685.1 cobyrinic acid ac-diamide synthase [Streptomyces regensis]TWH22771.1 cobyrinic acid a,c-diamide synthase [Prauserella rugosa]